MFALRQPVAAASMAATVRLMMRARGLAIAASGAPSATAASSGPQTLVLERPHALGPPGTNGQLLRMNDIRDNPGARKKLTRVGRGPGSGSGKMSGYGHKGQKSRSGGMHGKNYFEGGQTPIYRRLPKRGFTNALFRRELKSLNLGKLMEWVREGRVDPTQTITLKTIFDANLVGKIKHGVKLLATGKEAVDCPLRFEVTDTSAAARAAVEAAGGSVKLVYHNFRAMRALLYPHRVPTPRVNGVPPPRLRHKYEHLREEYNAQVRAHNEQAKELLAQWRQQGLGSAPAAEAEAPAATEAVPETQQQQQRVSA